MTAEGQNARAETPNEVYDRVQKWVEEKQFGTPEYQAISDYVELQTLEKFWRIYHQNLLSADDESKRLSLESQVRINEFQIALLNHQISQSKSRVSGYGKAYSNMVTFFEEELLWAAQEDALLHFPEDKKKQEEFYYEKYDSVYSNVEDLVYRKRE